jgi:hypothetical protein
MFACLMDGSLLATIGCANLRMKQGKGNMYIPFSLTSSNSGLVLSQERYRARATGVHRSLHRQGAESLERRAFEGGAGETA